MMSWQMSLDSGIPHFIVEMVDVDYYFFIKPQKVNLNSLFTARKLCHHHHPPGEQPSVMMPHPYLE
jgi:hypothetical protein